jgi:hypothetical protein
MIPLDTGRPARIPGDFERNSQGLPFVTTPDGKRRLYDRPSSWVFDDYAGIDPIYANRGSWVHKLCEHVDNGHAWRADLEFVAAGVGLGIGVDTQEAIARAWLRLLAEHTLTVVRNEANVVNDTLMVAGTLDRVVEWQGRHVVLDIKTGSKVAKTSIAVQLARYAGSLPYDTDTDTRGTW